MFDRILVPLDGSTLAETALPPALSLAQWSDSRVYLVRIPTYHQAVIPNAAGEAFIWEDKYTENARQEAEEYLLRIQKSNPQYEICTRVIEGDEAGTIVDVAEKEAIELILISTHGYSGLTRWLLGSVTERVLRAVHCPTMVVRNVEPIRNVLITLDGSNLSHMALQPGLEVARRFGATVCLLRAYQGNVFSPEKDVQLDWAGNDRQPPLYQGAKEGVIGYLQDIAQGATLPGEEIDVAAIEGSAADTILDYAHTQGFDLIVMATHGHTGLRRWVYGSVAEKVMRSAQCNVLITRPAADSLK